MTIQHLRSSTANKRPLPGSMSDGQIAVNTNTSSPGLFFKDSAGALIKVGPVHIGTTAPNASPASGGETGNSVGEQWLDTTGGTYVFKVWDGSAWRSETGTFVDVNGDVMTGALGIIAGSASAPGLYFSGDTNTGIYSPGADQVAISTNGTGRLSIDANGNVAVDTNTLYVDAVNNRVAVGTTSPGANLHISSSGNTEALIGASSGSSVLTMTAAVGAGGGSNLGFQGPLIFSSVTGSALAGATERCRLDSSGRLLVGTSSSYGDQVLQVIGGDTARVRIHRNLNDQFESELVISKARGTGSQILSNNDAIGGIRFEGTDGVTVIRAASIQAQVDGTPGTNDMPGRLVFSTTPDNQSPFTGPVERMRITSGGYLKASDNGTYVGSTSNYHEFNQSSTPRCVIVKASNASYAEGALTVDITRAANAAYKMFEAYSGSFGDREYELRGDGNAFADGTWTGGGADYAEYFEWTDSNVDDEDRRGISVVLDGDKIREAVAGEDPIGVISGNPSVVGDAAWNKWNGKYLRDEYGTYLLDANGDRQLNAAYDPGAEYIPREQRPEWDCVGLMGKLRIRKGQVTGSRWIKMRDISDSVEEWLVR